MNSQTVNFIKQVSIPLVIIIIISSCGGGSGEDRLRNNSTGMHSNINHAAGFEIEEFNGYRMLRVFDPWQGASNMTFEYVLADRQTVLPDRLPEGTLIRTPVESVICLSTTHLAMLDFIGVSEKITAVSGSRYIYNEELRRKIMANELPDIGYDINLDYELIIELQPDLIFAYGVGAETRSYVNRLQDLGLNVVLIGEYLEQSPLAQAEWVKFVSHFFNSQNMAYEKFSSIEDQYTALKNFAGETTSRPKVLTGLPWRDSWFVPGGNSLFAALISDAGGEYLFSNNTGRENFPVDMETVFSKATEADFWINTGTALSIEDIKKTDPRLAGLRPMVNNSVYNNNLRLNKDGGNDFWESGIINPHLILRDLINIMHPGILDNDELIYYHKL